MKTTKELIIETQNLQFGFNEHEHVLKNINLKVEKGSVYGFLGANGAGKTTTIRLLLGLLKTPGNTIHLFGRKLSENRNKILSGTGSLIEHPSLYEHLSGYDNLEISCSIRKVNRKRVAEVLQMVRLSEAAGRKVSQYSIGMKQRLGLAIALIGEPELLILDEPVNGLDPGGIVQIRELLMTLNKESGTTIFLSSHLLSEIEKMVTDVGIINKGELILQGTINELRDLHKDQCKFHLETNNNQSALEFLKSGYSVRNNKNELIVNCSSKEQFACIISDLVNINIGIYKAYAENKDLEQLFLGMTEKVQQVL